ncbi:CBS domain-containing protein [Micropruina sonneratiae]|uniref:CBS domain-containing protein n=1 Tax=Micropruina sonneratiae TaxID=2986940 RepID=UPI002227C0F7|nr:CBS domain-containing protein [Micropruina sp. KQZ13P-5]MCW3158724.1 CBS domain-containing protein [Micropruina sp. KQZ13P-5]
MRIEDIIRGKGAGVVTVEPGASVEQLVGLLGEHRIGAVVVSTDGVHIEGIVSERDVVRELGKQGAEVLQRTVGDIMTANVHTCGLEDTLEETAHTMTYQRFRHLPVVVDGELRGVISIGDVVKHRIDQLMDERNHLLGYLHA